MNIVDFEDSLKEVNKNVEEIQEELKAYHLEEKKRKEAQKQEDMKYVTFASVFVLFYVLWSTFDLATKLDPWNHTISNIGNYGFRLEFIIWGVTTGVMFVWYIARLFRLEKFKNKRALKWLGLSSFFLFLTVVTPSLPDMFPFFHFLHILWAGLFGIFLLMAMFFFIYYLSEDTKQISVRAFWAMGLLLFNTLILWLIFGNVAIWEVFFLSGFTLFLFLLTLGLERYEKQEELVRKIKPKKKKDN